METSVRKTLRAKNCFGALKIPDGDMLFCLASAHLKKNFVSVELPGMIPGYKFCIPVVNRVVLNLVF
jgi:hypothetical protein